MHAEVCFAVSENLDRMRRVGPQLGLIAIFSANGAASLPFGSLGGKLCFNPPIFRSAAKLGGGTPSVCNGQLTVTLQDLVAASPVVVTGAQIQAEFWARDPTNSDGFLLSDGLQFAVCP